MGTAVVNEVIPDLDGWLRLQGLQQQLKDAGLLVSLADVSHAMRHACGYVEGWQDANGHMDCDQAWRFSIAYAVLQAEYILENRWCLPNIRTSFALWLKTGKAWVE